MADITREECLNEFKRLTRMKGEPPKAEELYKETRITKYYISKFFKDGFDGLMLAAGYQPRLTISDKLKTPLEEMWKSYAEMLRKLSHPPSRSEWIYNRLLPT